LLAFINLMSQTSKFLTLIFSALLALFTLGLLAPQFFTKTDFLDQESWLTTISLASQPQLTRQVLLADAEQTLNLKPLLINHGFEQGWQGWDTQGNVQLLASDQSLSGQAAAQLSHAADSNLVTDNCLQQEFDFTAQDWPQLHFRYAVFSQEDLVVADQLAFIVAVNDQIAFRVGVKQALTAADLPLAPDQWQHGWLDLRPWLNWPLLPHNSGSPMPTITPGLSPTQIPSPALSATPEPSSTSDTPSPTPDSVPAPTPILEPQTVTLKFCAGNSADHQVSSWVWLDEIRSTDVKLQPGAQLLAQSNSPVHQVTYHYQHEGQEFSDTAPDQVSLSLNQELAETAVNFKLITNEADPENLAPEDIVHQASTQVWVDQTAPAAITDLTAFEENDQTLSLYFTPSQANAPHQLRASLTDFNPTDWSQLTSVTARPQTLTSLPLILGVQQHLSIEKSAFPSDFFSEEQVQQPGLPPLWLALKQCDLAGNCSAVSNIAVTQSLTPDPDPEQIHINELMFNPEGSDYGDWQQGEWVELYNAGPASLDVAAWRLVDAIGNQLAITSSNADSNQDLSDQGETIIPPQGWLLVYNQGSAIFNNSGDDVNLLTDQDQLIDSHTYSGQTVEGQTVGALPDGASDWQVDLISTPLAANRN
jgi:hypothetical protein